MQGDNLRLAFARGISGSYLTNVKVQVEQQATGKDKSRVLDVPSTGSMLFAKLSDGGYRVRAGYVGRVQTRTARVENGEPRKLIFYFPEK